MPRPAVVTNELKPTHAPATYAELSRLLARMGYAYVGMDDGTGEHVWEKEAAPHVFVRAHLRAEFGPFDTAGAAGKFCAVDGAVLASESMHEAAAVSLLPLLGRLEREALDCWPCYDCDTLVSGSPRNFRPRHTAHQVCGSCARRYRNCAACGVETTNRVCSECLFVCMFEENFPHHLTPAQRVWFAVIHTFSIFDEPGSVTRIARVARTNIPTVKRVARSVGDMLERTTGADGVTRYRLGLKNSRE